jgi:hypothetical protein
MKNKIKDAVMGALAVQFAEEDAVEKLFPGQNLSNPRNPGMEKLAGNPRAQHLLVIRSSLIKNIINDLNKLSKEEAARYMENIANGTERRWFDQYQKSRIEVVTAAKSKYGEIYETMRDETFKHQIDERLTSGQAVIQMFQNVKFGMKPQDFKTKINV